MAATMAMSSAPPNALTTIAASTFMILLPFTSTSRTPYDSGSVKALGTKDGSPGLQSLARALSWRDRIIHHLRLYILGVGLSPSPFEVRVGLAVALCLQW